MKYWLYLLAKLLVVAGVAFTLVNAVSRVYPKPEQLAKYGPAPPLFLHDMLFTFIMLGIGLIAFGLLFLTVWDQKRRCRSCLRRLMMPIARGSWGNMVIFGRPQTEWICPFGHGTLSIEELQITGRQFPDWQPHDDNIWKELESIHQAQK
jgi:H+/Cl- antiporter ClcA